MTGLTTRPFQNLVQLLKHSKKTVSVIEQCCGGTINSSILAQPGASSVYFGGSVIYNTKKSKPLLLNDDDLHQSLINSRNDGSKVELKSSNDYIESKFDWTAKTSVEFCKALKTDYVIAEGGAAGPTFTFSDMKTGFTVLSIAGKTNDASNSDGENVKILKQTLIHSTHADREKNMRQFADAAANLLADVIKEEEDTINTPVNEQDLSPKITTIDRATHLRSESKQITELESSSEARFIFVRNGDILVQSSNELALLPSDVVAQMKRKSENYTQTFLGLLTDESKTPIFGIDIIGESDNQEKSQLHDFDVEGCYFVNTRTSAPLFNKLHNELALHIMAYANWQRKSRFCVSCGSPMTLIHAGTAMKCSACDSMSWPRQDPSMIASITSRCGEHILLARSNRHPPKMHTVLAGFVEAGETFEAAVTREVWEETGVRIDEGSVRYIGSQPWPFPQSCMIAFTATADDKQTLNIDENELVEAKWFNRHEVSEATKVTGAVMQHDVAKTALKENPTIQLLIPPKKVIARKLIDEWLANK